MRKLFGDYLNMNPFYIEENRMLLY